MLGAEGKSMLLRSLSCMSCIYALATLMDFAQCHFQAGGIGRHCHGYNCVQVALVLACTSFIGQYEPQVFCAVCFGGQGLYRLWWALREDRPAIVQSVVCGISILLVLFPIILYVEEIVHWQIGMSKCESEDKVDTRVMVSV